jgi:outer membrane protein OmpA-like peptidoglycan-associated protein
MPGSYGSATMDDSDFRPGDLRAYLKVPIIRGAWPLAIRLGATFPTGGHDAFSGALGWTLTPELIASHSFGPLDAAINVGYRFRERNGLEAPAGSDSFVIDDELVYGLGARYNITPRFGVNAELIGRIGVSAGPMTSSRLPLEVLGGVTLRATDALSFQLGVGRGLSGGYGTPDIRGYAGARLSISQSRCHSGPEDFDGFEDGDYCADPDNDGDGILDAHDRCPNDAEDRDGFLDDDGCPDPDNDADGVLDNDDRCPSEPEDRDGYEDTDGCPEGDNDRDGVPDGRDECPMEPEDLDNYQDDDGCPEPGPEAVVVTRTESHLLLSQRIFFDYDSDTIRSVSLPILNEVALTLRRNPDITRVRIEGYTDNRGTPQYNVDLSYRRARAVVEYLASREVARDRLDYQGYGATHPVADDHTPEGQALNRRVEFTIVSQGGEAPPRPNSGGPNSGRRHGSH